jgi:hypothetical protein
MLLTLLFYKSVPESGNNPHRQRSRAQTGSGRWRAHLGRASSGVIKDVAIVGLRQQFDEVESSQDYGPYVQIGLGTVVVLLDLVHVHGFGNPSHLVDLAAVVQQRWRIRHRTDVAFEVDHVDFVKAN